MPYNSVSDQEGSAEGACVSETGKAGGEEGARVSGFPGIRKNRMAQWELEGGGEGAKEWGEDNGT